MDGRSVRVRSGGSGGVFPRRGAGCAGREQSQDVVTALCDAREEIGRDVGATEAIFFDGAHDGLHDLANDAAEMDRSVAARLLEAKQTVEADLEETPSRRVLAKDFDALLDSTRRALEATSVAAPNCRQGGDGD
jgi:hypothetical protein